MRNSINFLPFTKAFHLLVMILYLFVPLVNAQETLTPSLSPRNTPYPTIDWSFDFEWPTYDDYRTSGPTGDDDYIYNDDNSENFGPIYFAFMFTAFILAVCFGLGKYSSRMQSSSSGNDSPPPVNNQAATFNNTVRPTAPPATLDNEAMTTDRSQQFVEKFRFQIVLPDKSNTNAESIRYATPVAKEDGEPDIIISSSNDDDDDGDDEGSKIQAPNPTTSSSSFSSWRKMLSSWRIPQKDDICCFCLESYEPGQLICVGATEACNHVFHEECMKSWFRFKKMDTCPICRCNFVTS